MSLAAAVKHRALKVGFDLAGVAPLAAWKDLEFSREWVQGGFGGEMHYLENPKRDDPRLVLPSAKSIVCAALLYNVPLPYSVEVAAAPLTRPACGRPPIGSGRRAGGEGVPRAWISRYAWGGDYHEVMRAKLEQLRGALEELAPRVETRVYVDTGPIVERAFARFSGIGWTGKNTCLINERKGSWFFLGVILTSLELEPDLPAPDRCGSCTACLEACPTGALVEPYVMDASRCISYLTIELRGSIPEKYRSAIGSNVFGCDICQDVCPWNSRPSGQRRMTSAEPAVQISNTPVISHPSPASSVSALSAAGGESRGEAGHGGGASPRNGISVATTREPEFQPLEIELAGKKLSLFNPPLETLASMNEEEFRKTFRHSPIKRAKYRGWLRNLCVAMGNSGERRFVTWLERLREHPDPNICEHAAWALKELRKIGTTPMS